MSLAHSDSVHCAEDLLPGTCTMVRVVICNHGDFGEAYMKKLPPFYGPPSRSSPVTDSVRQMFMRSSALDRLKISHFEPRFGKKQGTGVVKRKDLSIIYKA